MKNYDVIIIGAGITGLSIAYYIKTHFSDLRILIIDKENSLGRHASGRNSGVIHSGIYYEPTSLKAKLCNAGAKLMIKFCQENSIPFNKTGKLLIPASEEQCNTLKKINRRAKLNGIYTEIINEKQIHEIEPSASTKFSTALFVPETAVINPMKILDFLFKWLSEKGVHIKLSEEIQHYSSAKKHIVTKTEKINYGHIFNAAGAHADKIMKHIEGESNYRILPFKGSYFEMKDDKNTPPINKLIYPIPDLNLPFLGVHFTKSLQNKIYIGPNATPALGRENYSGAKGLNLEDSSHIIKSIIRLYSSNKQNFREYSHNEITLLFKKHFISAAQKLVPNLRTSHIIKSSKVGIRAQLYNTKKNKLEMDFVVEKGSNATHILNVVSPGFTSAFSFSKYIVDHHFSQRGLS